MDALAATMFGIGTSEWEHGKMVRSRLNTLQHFQAPLTNRFREEDDFVYIGLGLIFERSDAQLRFGLGDEEVAREPQFKAGLAGHQRALPRAGGPQPPGKTLRDCRPRRKPRKATFGHVSTPVI